VSDETDIRSELQSSVTDEPGIRVAVIHEPQIDHDRVDAFKAFLERYVFSSEQNIILHLAGVEYLSSVALGLLSLASVMAEKRRLGFVVVCAREEVLKLFVISGLYKAVKISNTVDSAKLKLATGKASPTS